MKMKNLELMMQAQPENNTDVIHIFESIGEYEDYDGKMKGAGPKKLTEMLAECKHDSLEVHINSGGGSLYDGIAMMNILKNSGKKITTVIDGIAASAASLIALAGEKILMNPCSQFMIHNPTTVAWGNADDFRKLVDYLESTTEMLRQTYADRSSGKLTTDQVKAYMDAETYFSAAEAKAVGLCDEIIGQEDDEEEAVENAAPLLEDAAEKITDIENQTDRKVWFF